MWQIATFGVKVICFIVNSEISNGCWKLSKKATIYREPPLTLHLLSFRLDVLQELISVREYQTKNLLFQQDYMYFSRNQPQKHWKTKTMFREIHEQTSLNISCNSTPNSLTLLPPQVTKREFLLTISIQYQAGRWWE